MMKLRKTIAVLSITGMLSGVAACSTESVVDNTVGATGFVAKTAVKGTIGAGKMAVKGAKKIAGTE